MFEQKVDKKKNSTYKKILMGLYSGLQTFKEAIHILHNAL